MAKPKKAPADTYVTRRRDFLQRSNGDDVVGDIAFLAEDMRARTGHALHWDKAGSGTRILWGLAIGAAAEMIGMTTDEYLAAARKHIRAEQKRYGRS